MLFPTDEHGHFKMARDILSGTFADHWLFTVGNALWQMPFMVAVKAETYLDICRPLSLFNALVTAPAALVLLWLIVERISPSRVFKCVFAVPPINPGSAWLYDMINAIGYNGQSDMPSTAVALLCIFLGLRLRAGLWQFALVSALFGFDCLLRISNIFLVPLIAAILCWRLLDERAAWRRVLGLLAVGAAVFLVVFAVQFAANIVQFSNPLTFPYVLHQDDSAKGFVLSLVPRGVEFLIGCNYPYVCLAAAALPFAAVGRQRGIVCLWGIPLLLFFCGYPVVSAAPIRFILTCYPAFLAALALILCWCVLGFLKEFAGSGLRRTLQQLARTASPPD